MVSIAHQEYSKAPLYKREFLFAMIAFHIYSYLFDTIRNRQEKTIIALTEKEILAHHGMKEGENLILKDVFIGEDEFIHTAIIGDLRKPPLLFVHGFLGTLVYYSNLYMGLSQHFCVYSIDCPGAGLSSRVHFSPKTNEEAVAYFVDRIEKFKKTIGLDKFYLAGHSMGAYCSFFYTIKNPEDVKCLFMLSPAGFREVDYDHPFVQNLNNPKTFKEKMQKELDDFLHNRQLNYRDFLGFLGPVSRDIIREISKKAFKIKDEELEMMTEYSYHLSRMKTCWDKAVHLIFKDGPYSRNPMIKHIERLKHKCFIYFGYFLIDELFRRGF